MITDAGENRSEACNNEDEGESLFFEGRVFDTSYRFEENNSSQNSCILSAELLESRLKTILSPMVKMSDEATNLKDKSMSSAQQSFVGLNAQCLCIGSQPVKRMAITANAVVTVNKKTEYTTHLYRLLTRAKMPQKKNI